jgi:hypothetical protein
MKKGNWGGAYPYWVVQPHKKKKEEGGRRRRAYIYITSSFFKYDSPSANQDIPHLPPECADRTQSAVNSLANAILISVVHNFLQVGK